jgi:hypothetical protein
LKHVKPRIDRRKSVAVDAARKIARELAIVKLTPIP